jgi:hypothetical protein
VGGAGGHFCACVCELYPGRNERKSGAV